MVTRPIEDEELHAYVDGQLGSARRIQVDAWLAEDEDGLARVEAYRAQADALHLAFDSVLTEPLKPEIAALAGQLRMRLEGRTPVSGMAGVWLQLRDLAGHVAADAVALRPSWVRDPDLWRPDLLWKTGPFWVRRHWVQASVAVVLVVVGAAGGYGLRAGSGLGTARQPGAATVASDTQQAQPALKTFAEEAVQAHVFYTTDSPQPVEFAADDRGELNRRLSERLGKAVFGPDLGSVGYRLIGGRSLPIATGAGAQYMYQNSQGKRLTLLVGRPKTGQETAFRFYQQDDRAMFYWVEGALAYAVVGPINHDELMKVAEAVYKVMKDPPVEAGKVREKAMPPVTAAPSAVSSRPSVQQTSAQQPAVGAPRTEPVVQPMGGAVQPVGQRGPDMQPKQM